MGIQEIGVIVLFSLASLYLLFRLYKAFLPKNKGCADTNCGCSKKANKKFV
jgi:hypothetical protein